MLTVTNKMMFMGQMKCSVAVALCGDGQPMQGDLGSCLKQNLASVASRQVCRMGRFMDCFNENKSLYYQINK